MVSIMMMMPITDSSDVISCVRFCCSVLLMLSRSLTARLRISPCVLVSKKRSGSRLNLPSTSRRKAYTVFCATPDIRYCCRYWNSGADDIQHQQRPQDVADVGEVDAGIRRAGRAAKVALEDLGGGHAHHLGPDHAEQRRDDAGDHHDDRARGRCGAEVAGQPAQRALEVLGLLDRNAEAAHRPAAEHAGRGRRLPQGRSFGAHAASPSVGLRLGDLAIHLARLQQLGVRANPHHPPIVQHDDAVGVHHRADALRDDEDGRVGEFGLERRAQPGIGREVERREAVVEHVDRGAARPARAQSPAAASGRPTGWCRPATPARHSHPAAGR